MTILETINSNLTAAIKQRNQPLVEALRGAKSSLEFAYKTGKKVDEISVLRTEVKKRNEAAEIYKIHGRLELLEKENFEATVIEGFLPTMMTMQEVYDYVVKKFKDSSLRPSIGQATGMVMKDLKGRVDGNVVRDCVEGYMKGKQ